MIEPGRFLKALDAADIRFVTGVPDSLLKDVCACIATNYLPDRHIIATNEGSAVGLAIGHYLATGRPALVYLQNSGLGNAVNPVTSLADPQVYGVPIIFLIGWRGEILADGGQLRDEPQHVKQGKVTPGQLGLLDIPYRVVDSSSDIDSVVTEMAQLASGRSRPVALLVRKGTFASFRLVDPRDDQHLITRESAISCVLACTPDDLPVVATTGMASREVFELRKKLASGHHRDFLTVGGMGHASQIAAGIALSCANRKVLCLDGDGALLMHMGGLAISAKRPNLVHVVFNNGAHDSVGGQATQAIQLNLANIARECGYGWVRRASNIAEIRDSMRPMLEGDCSCFLEVMCRRGARPDLGRPDRTPQENKEDFMKFLGGAGER
jgi:phosphonopyruvate decarboxylase